MSLWLKQSTSVVHKFGPFVDKTDGVSLEVGLATAMDNVTTGIRISKNGGNYAARNATVTTTTYDEMGEYNVTLDTTDTATLGTLKMIFEEAATCLPVWVEFMVVPANVWDSFFGADNLDVSVTQWLGTAAATPTVAGVPEVDVTHWIGTAAATPTTAGVPEVDVTHLGGGAQSATDLKDFADAGYDPATNKVQGVVLVDTTTTLTNGSGSAYIQPAGPLGDYVGDETELTVTFRTYAADGTPVTCSGFDVTDIDIYTGDTISPRSSTNGFTLIDTDGIDINGVTGLNGFIIDLTDNTDAGFYGTGQDFYITLGDITVDGVTLAGTLASFSIQNRFMEGTNSAATAAALAAAQLDLDKITGADGATLATAQALYAPAKQADIVTGGAPINTTGGVIDEVALLTGNTVQSGDSFSRIGANGAGLTDLATAAKLLAYVQLLLRADAAIETDNAAELTEINANGGSGGGTYSAQTDSQENIRAELVVVDTVVDQNNTDIGNLNNITVADILTTQMTESYAADGVAPTLAEALFLIQQARTEFAIAGTTYTVKKINKITTGATYTLDDGTNPTSMTRAS